MMALVAGVTQISFTAQSKLAEAANGVSAMSRRHCERDLCG